MIFDDNSVPFSKLSLNVSSLICPCKKPAANKSPAPVKSRFPDPGGNVYCASKYAVNAINKGMRIDLNKYNIRVSGIHPGLVETEFSMVRFKGDEQRSESVYNTLDALQAEDVANAIAYMVEVPPHVTVADLTLLPTDQANATVINRKK